jgi:hypothetical protein
MFFIDNQNKDLTEVRDKDTGVLLGWIPVTRLSEPYIDCAAPATLPRKIKSMVGVSALEYAKVRLDYAPLHFGMNLVRCYEVAREDWKALVRES